MLATKIASEDGGKEDDCNVQRQVQRHVQPCRSRSMAVRNCLTDGLQAAMMDADGKYLVLEGGDERDDDAKTVSTCHTHVSGDSGILDT